MVRSIVFSEMFKTGLVSLAYYFKVTVQLNMSNSRVSVMWSIVFSENNTSCRPNYVISITHLSCQCPENAVRLLRLLHIFKCTPEFNYSESKHFETLSTLGSYQYKYQSKSGDNRRQFS